MFPAALGRPILYKPSHTQAGRNRHGEPAGNPADRTKSVSLGGAGARERHAITQPRNAGLRDKGLSVALRSWRRQIPS